MPWLSNTISVKPALGLPAELVGVLATVSLSPSSAHRDMPTAVSARGPRARPRERLRMARGRGVGARSSWCCCSCSRDQDPTLSSRPPGNRDLEVGGGALDTHARHGAQQASGHFTEVPVTLPSALSGRGSASPPLRPASGAAPGSRTATWPSGDTHGPALRRRSTCRSRSWCWMYSWMRPTGSSITSPCRHAGRGAACRAVRASRGRSSCHRHAPG